MRDAGRLVLSVDETGLGLGGAGAPARWNFADCLEAEDAGGLIYLWPRSGPPAIVPTRVFAGAEAAAAVRRIPCAHACRVALPRPRPVVRRLRPAPGSLGVDADCNDWRRLCRLGVGRVPGRFRPRSRLRRQGRRQDRRPARRPGADLRARPGANSSSRNQRAGRLSFTTDIAERYARREAVFIAVGTPTLAGDGDADLRYVFAGGARDRRRDRWLHRGGQQVDRRRSAPATRSSGSSANARRRTDSPSSPTRSSCARAPRSTISNGPIAWSSASRTSAARR